MNLLVLHGPNLNLLGEREPGVYGALTLKELDAAIREHARRLGVTVRIKQSNHEGVLIDALHGARKWADGCVFNPGAYTHYSYALRDAVAACAIPTVEVHLSNIYKREAFRRVSVIEPVCVGQVVGKGIGSYTQGMDSLVRRLRRGAPQASRRPRPEDKGRDVPVGRRRP